MFEGYATWSGQATHSSFVATGRFVSAARASCAFMLDILKANLLPALCKSEFCKEYMYVHEPECIV